jgi:hypothetical protein
MTFEQAVEAASAGATLAEIVTGLAGDSEPEQNQGPPGVGND